MTRPYMYNLVTVKQLTTSQSLTLIVLSIGLQQLFILNPNVVYFRKSFSLYLFASLSSPEGQQKHFKYLREGLFTNKIAPFFKKSTSCESYDLRPFCLPTFKLGHKIISHHNFLSSSFSHPFNLQRFSKRLTSNFHIFTASRNDKHF